MFIENSTTAIDNEPTNQREGAIGNAPKYLPVCCSASSLGHRQRLRPCREQIEIPRSIRRRYYFPPTDFLLDDAPQDRPARYPHLVEGSAEQLAYEARRESQNYFDDDVDGRRGRVRQVGGDGERPVV